MPGGWLGVFEFYVFDLHDGRASLAHSLTIEVPRGRFEVPGGRFGNRTLAAAAARKRNVIDRSIGSLMIVF